MTGWGVGGGGGRGLDVTARRHKHSSPLFPFESLNQNQLSLLEVFWSSSSSSPPPVLQACLIARESGRFAESSTAGKRRIFPLFTLLQPWNMT